jgi:hemoglobin
MNENITLYERIGGHKGIAKLLHHFYADVRQHKLIGPIFNQKIHEWPAHEAKITEFWARVTGGPSQYVGPMPEKHFSLNLQPEHFEAWLGLWTANCRIYFKPKEAEEMMGLALEIGKRLKNIISDVKIK